MASAARKSFLNYFGGGGERVNAEAELDFDESDVWNPNMGAVQVSDQAKKSMINNSRPLKKPILRKSSASGINHVNQQRSDIVAAASLPVNIPDWSRILGDEYFKSSNGNKRESENHFVDDEEDEYGKLPPHEYLARTRGSSFSVHEGIGRTLKGRDLRRVRNAVWKQTGFED